MPFVKTNIVGKNIYEKSLTEFLEKFESEILKLMMVLSLARTHIAPPVTA